MTSSSSMFWCEHALIAGRVRAGVSIVIRNGRFSSIACDMAAPVGATRLAGFTVPGFANAHSHAFHRALRSRTQAGSGNFWTWRDTMYAAAARLDPDSYHRLARATFAEMATTGMSSVGEFHYVHHQPDGSRYDDINAMGEALLAAAAEAGIRITLLDTLYLLGGLASDGHHALSPLQRRYDDSSAELWAARVDELAARADPARQRVGAAIHSVRAADTESMRVAAAWAQANHAPLHAHVSEQIAENESCLAHYGCTPMALFEQAGALTADFTAVHATHLTRADLALLASAGASVCMCPTTERDLGDGIGPSVALATAGVPICLGSDSHAAIDHLGEARALELDERLRSRERGLHRPLDLLTMATAAGHEELGWPDAGSIAVGKRADLTTIALDSIRTAGATPALAVETVLFAATTDDVTHVVIDGISIAGHGHHSRIDVAAELDASIEELFA